MECLRKVYKFFCCISDSKFPTPYDFNFGTKADIIYINGLAMQADREMVSLNDFSMLSLIGVGNYAKVILVRKRDSNRIYAMKIVKKRKEYQIQIKGIKKTHAYIEKQILGQCQHPFIVRLHSTFQRQRKLYYILEYCPGGELFGVIRRLKRLSQQSSKFYAAQILLALQHLHSKGFVYRDLKPENVLIDRKGYIKLVDFGLSCRADQVNKTDVIAGTPQYLPPEVFQKGVNIGYFTDWWAFGNLLFEMLTGFPPFFVQHQKFEVIKNKICQEEPPLYFINNPILRDLLHRLLQKNPLQRLGTQNVNEIKNHSWFYGTNWPALLLQQLPAPFTPVVKSDCDTHWFQFQHNQLTPPEQDSDKNSHQKYQQFTSSWKSSPKDLQLSPQQNASPTEITISIQEMKMK